MHLKALESEFLEESYLENPTLPQEEDHNKQH